MAITDPDYIEAVLARRGTTNGNDRGSAANRRARRAWVMVTWASDRPGRVRCYRCGCLLYNPDDHPGEIEPIYTPVPGGFVLATYSLSIDRIIPGCQGGTYRRNNIRPACGRCNSETGGRTRRKGK